MKKFSSFLITVVCALTLFSCTVNTAAPDNTSDTPTNSGTDSGKMRYLVNTKFLQV